MRSEPVPTTIRTAARFAPKAHGLSFDVECYYQIIAKDFLSRFIEPTEEVVRNTEWILETLSRHRTKATFFTLGNVARRFPALVKRMAAAGHELAVHGDEHLYLMHLSPAAFREELKRARGPIEDAVGRAVSGHRAPAFSVTAETLWALDVLKDMGFAYDSSIFPIKGKRYGIPEAPRTAYRLPNGLIEVPLTAVTWRGRTMPAAGGGYARLFPYAFSRWALNQCEAEGRPAVTYFHPHEFEPTAPRLPPRSGSVPLSRRLKLMKFNAVQARGRGPGFRRKLERLLGEFRFVPVGEIAAELMPDGRM